MTELLSPSLALPPSFPPLHPPTLGRVDAGCLAADSLDADSLAEDSRGTGSGPALALALDRASRPTASHIFWAAAAREASCCC